MIVSFGVVARAWSCLLIRYGAGESDVANASGLQIDAARTGNIEDTFTNEDDEAAHANDSRGQAVHAEAWPVSRVHLLLYRDSRPGAVEVDLQRFFRVTPPVVHQMIKTLAARRFIEREPRTARSMRLRLTRSQLPDLE